MIITVQYVDKNLILYVSSINKIILERKFIHQNYEIFGDVIKTMNDVVHDIISFNGFCFDNEDVVMSFDKDTVMINYDDGNTVVNYQTSDSDYMRNKRGIGKIMNFFNGLRLSQI